MKKAVLMIIVVTISLALHAQPFTWSEPINISNLESGYSNEPSICVDSNDNIYMVWRYPSSGFEMALYFSWSDDGQTWSIPEKIYDDGGQVYGPNMVSDSVGTLYLTFEKFYADFGRVVYMNRETGVWSDPIQLSVDSLGTAFNNDIIIDNNNWVYVFWVDADLFWTYFDGNSWSDIEVISNITIDHQIAFPEAVVDNNNDIHLVYTVFLSGPDKQTYYQKYDGNEWSNMVNISRNDTLWAINPDITVDSGNVPHIVWQQLIKVRNSNYDIYYSTLLNNNEWSNPENISNLTQLHNIRPKIQIINGRPIVFYTGEGPLFYSYHDIAGWDINNFELDLTLGAIFDFIVDKHDIPHLAVAKIEPQLGNIYYISSKARASIFTPEILQPTHFTIGNPYPNPFNASTTFSFYLPNPNEVQVNIYDIRGRLIWEQCDYYNSGLNKIIWNSNNYSIPSGIYLYEIILNDELFIKKSDKFILIK